MKQYTLEELSKYNATDPSLPILICIKTEIFDVSSNAEMYTPPKGYSVFAGKNASRALAKSSLKPEECIGDINGLKEDELKTLEKWVEFFRKKYPIVGELIP